MAGTSWKKKSLPSAVATLVERGKQGENGGLVGCKVQKDSVRKPGKENKNILELRKGFEV